MKIAITATGPDLESQVDARFGRCAYFIIIDPDTMEFEALENPNIALGGGAGIQSAQLMAQKEVKTVLTGNCGPNAFQTFGAAGVQVIVGVNGIAREAVERFKKGEFTATDSSNVESHFGMGAGGGQGNGQASFFSNQQENTGQGGGTMGSGKGGGMGGGRGGGIGGGMGGGMGGGKGGGMGGGRGGGRGGGMGGGRGGGMGGGMGRGMGGGVQSNFTTPPTTPSMDPPQPAPGPMKSEQELAMLMEQAKGIEMQLNEVNARIREVEHHKNGLGLMAWVDPEQCNGCSRCLSVCPEKAIALMDNIAYLDRARCTGCGQCVAECPQNALCLKKA